MKPLTMLIALILFIPILFSCKSGINPDSSGLWDKYSGNPVLSKSNEISGDRVDWDYFCAYSSDGTNWTKYENNPVLEPSPGGWDYVGLETVSILLDPEAPKTERYKMWYDAVDTVVNRQETDYRSNIGYAKSNNCKNWVKHADNPVLSTGNWGEWDASVIQDPFVMKIDKTYYMWHSWFPEWIEGTDLTGVYSIGLAYSSDGINWIKSENNPVLRKGSNGRWDDVLVGFPSIILEGDVLKMYYTGLNESIIPEFPQPYNWDIGYATLYLADLNP